MTTHRTQLIVCPGDVIAAGLHDGRCPLGRVVAVTSHGIRLTTYPWPGQPAPDVEVLLWGEIRSVRVADRRRGHCDLTAVADFQTAWLEGSR